MRTTALSRHVLATWRLVVQRQRSLRALFQRWRITVRLRLRERDAQNQVAERFRCNRLACKTLAAWKLFTVERRRTFMVAYRKAGEFARQRALRRAFEEWHAVKQLGSEQRGRLVTAFQARRATTHLRRALLGWRSVTVHHRNQLEVATVTFAARRDLVRRNFFLAVWIRRVLHRSHLRKVLFHWSSWAKAKARLRAAEAAARRRRALALARHAFNKWRQAVLLGRRREQNRLASLRQQLQAHFNGWRIVASQQALGRAAAERMRAQRNRRRAAVALTAWATIAQRNRQQRLEAICEFLLFRARRWLSRWRALAETSKAERARRRWSSLFVAAGWCRVLAAALRRRSLAITFRGEMERRRTARLLAAWRSAAAARSAQLRRAEQLRLATQSRRLRVVIAAWRAAAAEASSARGRAGDMCHARHRTTMACCFVAWRVQTAIGKQRAAQLQQLLPAAQAKVAQVTALRMLRRWRLMLARRQQTHSDRCLQLLAERWKEYSRRRRVRKALETWRSKLHLERRLDEFRNRKRRRYLTRWQDALSAKRYESVWGPRSQLGGAGN